MPLTKLAQRLMGYRCPARRDEGTHEFPVEQFGDPPTGNRRVCCTHCQVPATKLAIAEGLRG